MKNTFNIAVLFVVALMLFCVTGCGDTAGGTTAQVMQRTPLTLEAI